jgi:uncharacterized membrane protein
MKMKIARQCAHALLVLAASSFAACGFRESKTGAATGAVSPPANGTGGAQTSGGGGGGASVTFSQVSAQVFQARCTTCHGSGGTRPDLSNAAFAGDPTYVVAGHPETSRIVQVVQSGSMPQGGAPLTAGQISLLSTWISQGALNN